MNDESKNEGAGSVYDGLFEPLGSSPQVQPDVREPVFPSTEARLVHAAEYIAAQLGLLNQKLDRFLK